MTQNHHIHHNKDDDHDDNKDDDTDSLSLSQKSSNNTNDGDKDKDDDINNKKNVLPLKTLLLLPIHRIGKYELLIRNILSKTDELNPDYNLINKF